MSTDEIRLALEAGLEHAIDAANERKSKDIVFENCMRDVRRIEAALAYLTTKPSQQSQPGDEPCMAWSDEHQTYVRPNALAQQSQPPAVEPEDLLADAIDAYSASDTWHGVIGRLRCRSYYENDEIHVRPALEAIRKALRSQQSSEVERLREAGREFLEATDEKVFLTTVSEGGRNYHISMQFRTMDEMHEAHDKLTALVAAIRTILSTSRHQPSHVEVLEALQHAIEIIDKHVREEDLGYHSSPSGEWSYKAEYLHHFRTALARSQENGE